MTAIAALRPGRAIGSPLFPTRIERECLEERLTQELMAAGQRVRCGAVAPTINREAFRRELDAFDFHEPAPLDDLLSWTITRLEEGVTQVTSPRYFGLFNPAPTFPSQCADRITAAFNPQLATATTSPAAVEIEAHVIRAVAQRAGLPPESGGHFTSGGTEANYTSLICALTQAEPRFGETGARAFAGQPVFYASRESHLAWLKIAHQAGVGRAAVRLVPTDGSGRLDTAALEPMIEGDRAAGAIPVMIVATAGTTNAGMIDPLSDCAAIARRYGLWFHVDAAWGGALIAADRLRPQLGGIEKADSVTIDAHKWFATTMGCGMILIRDPRILPRVFEVTTGYMPSHDAGHDPYMSSAQWSRRFLGLRLFLSLAAAGWKGYGRHVERTIGLASLLATRMETRGWTIANRSPVAVVCAEPPASSPDIATIVARVLASGRAWVSAATFEGRPVLRACPTNGETTVDDVGELVAVLEAAR
jgi:glutamate/tyrosine decarboxylase-like PLP-dependent enzyme